MKCSWLSVLTEKRDAGCRRAMNGRVGWCRMLWHNFLVWKLTSDPPVARRLTPGPKLMLSSLCAGCHWLLSASVWTPMRGHDSGTETNCHWWATVDISDRFEPSHNRLWCPKPLFPLHFSFLLAVTVSHHSQELRLKTWTRQSEFTLKTVRSSPNSMGWIWNYYPTVSNVKLL